MPTRIHDGLTETAYLTPVPRLTGELRFSFRPMPIDSLHRFLDGLRGRSLLALGKAEAEAVAARLGEWSLMDDDGNPLPITADIIRSLHPSLFRRVKEIVVYGTEGGDPDPLMPHDADFAELIADAAASGTTMAELREERDAKN